MDEDRDVFAKQLDHDRTLRRLAITLVPGLLPLSHDERLVAVEKARKLVRLLEGGLGPVKAVPASAALLYSKLPLECPRDALRVLHIVETTLNYIESGVVDARSTRDIVVLLGGPTTEAAHLRLGPKSPANDCEVVILPDILSRAGTTD